ncbi:DUF3710 domain-containing protein [Oryzobacter sp. R7]|uniref:DUF3710 domain-containing protein n=1 Tax=Oryzobacter faecalis TaxID=3388656 RepID=UPI00398D4D1C
MSIFKRKKDAETVEVPEGSDEAGTVEQAGGPTASDADADIRVDGPWDVAEVEGRDGRVDLGALWLRGVEGMELRLELDQQTQQVNAATAVIGDSALQLQAFAAPRTEGLWDDIRGEIASAVESQGGTVEEHAGGLGTELRTRMPSAGPDGRTVFAPATFVGVDGPRWFLRGVLSGRAAIDEVAAGPLLDVLRAAVVVRGTEPMAPRELLPLSLPRDAAAEAAAAEAEGEAGEQRRPSLDPFERGPEITEVR